MAPRPQPRKSTLAKSPVVAATPAAAPKKAPAAPKATARPAGAPLPASEATKKTSFYQPVEDIARMRAAFVNTSIAQRDGAATLSEFIALAVREKLDRIEKKHNGGKPFSGAGEVPKGRPVR